MKKLLTILLFGTQSLGMAQGWEWSYSSTAFDYGRAIVQTADTGFAIAGATSSWGTGTMDAYLIKTDPLGNFEWSKTYGTPQGEWAMEMVQVTADSGFAMVGYTNGLGAGGYDVLLLRTDKDGNELWRKTYGGTDWDFGYSLSETSDGGFLLCGETFSFGSGNNDAYLIKTDANGDTLWTRAYGGSANESANDVIETSDAAYTFIGYTDSYGAGDDDIYLVKTDFNGDTLWTRTFGYAGPDQGEAIMETWIGGYLILGNSDSTLLQNNPQLYLSRLDLPDGNPQWVQYHGSASAEYGYALSQHPQFATIFIMGYDNVAGQEQVMLIKTDYDGFWVNSFNYGSWDFEAVYDAVLCMDSTVAMAGTSETYGIGQSSVYVLKLDNMCNSALIQEYEDVTPVPSYDNNEQMRVFPNPANNELTVTIEADQSSNYQLHVFDALGRFMKHQFLEETQNTVDVSQLPQGTYILRLFEGDELRATTKLIIKR